MRSGRRRETPTMGVVVAVPDRRQLDLPPRSLVLSRHARRRDLQRGMERPRRKVGFAQLQRPIRGLRTFGLRSLRRQSDLPWWRGLVARHKQGMLARAAVSRARRPALAVAGYPGAPWTDQTAERMLPLCGGGVHALQGRCREARAGPINGPPSQRGLQVGQDHPGRPNPCRGHRFLRTPPPAASRPADSTCWTRIGKNRSSKSARPASTPFLPTAKTPLWLGIIAAGSTATGWPSWPALEDDVDSQHRSLP